MEKSNLSTEIKLKSYLTLINQLIKKTKNKHIKWKENIIEGHFMGYKTDVDKQEIITERYGDIYRFNYDYSYDISTDNINNLTLKNKIEELYQLAKIYCEGNSEVFEIADITEKIRQLPIKQRKGKH